MTANDLTTLLNGGRTCQDAVRDIWVSRYAELRGLARQVLAGDRAAKDMPPTELVHEAFVRLVDRSRITDEGTAFFKCCFATECRRILVDEVRKRRAAKRGGEAVCHSLSAAGSALGVEDVDLLDLHEIIETLATQHERVAQIIDMRVYGGLTVPECARLLDVSTGTIDRDWAFGRAWLRRAMAKRGET